MPLECLALFNSIDVNKFLDKYNSQLTKFFLDKNVKGKLLQQIDRIEE